MTVLRTALAVAGMLLTASCASGAMVNPGGPASVLTSAPASSAPPIPAPIGSVYFAGDSAAGVPEAVVVLRSRSDVERFLAWSQVRHPDSIAADLRRHADRAQILVSRTTGCARAISARLIARARSMVVSLTTGSTPPECFRPYTMLAVFTPTSVPVGVTVDGRAPDERYRR